MSKPNLEAALSQPGKTEPLTRQLLPLERFHAGFRRSMAAVRIGVDGVIDVGA